MRAGSYSLLVRQRDVSARTVQLLELARWALAVAGERVLRPEVDYRTDFRDYGPSIEAAVSRRPC